jgi:hypothetical protein
LHAIERENQVIAERRCPPRREHERIVSEAKHGALDAAWASRHAEAHPITDLWLDDLTPKRCSRTGKEHQRDRNR